MGLQPSKGERMYRRLQLEPEASPKEIRSAYRRLAHDVHPDANPEDPDASQRFCEITEAYEILSRPDRHADHDRARWKAGRSIRPDRAGPISTGASGVAGRYHVGPPTAIGISARPMGSAPLVAGPVRIVPLREAPNARPSDDRGETSRLSEAVWLWWNS